MSAITPLEKIGGGDARPLPEIIADMHGFRLAHVDDLDMRYYAVQDWIAGVTGVKDAKTVADTWRGLKRDRRKNSDSDKRPTLKLADMVISMPYRATDGKTYQRDYADAATLNIITQRLNASTPLAESLRAYLAKAGVLVDDQRRNPAEHAVQLAADAESKYDRLGKSEHWKGTRFQGIVSRKAFTDALKAHVADIQDKDYGKVTNSLYRTLWGRDAGQLKEEIGIKPTANLRDHQPVEALAYQMLLESAVAHQLQQRETVEVADVAPIVEAVGEIFARQAAEASQLFGRDLATNKPLLPKR